MVTTIQISENLHKELTGKRLYENETYEEVIWDMIEDTMELSEETKKDLQKSRAEAKAGKTHSISEVKSKLGV